ncbi:hypothetical protein CFP56_018590 [Quercus suber]|uniref:Uncharacterized protein n=1 Tax=Quercus suber TaxID=58331 RepID=A0AAW0M3J4_QUESU
MDYHCPEFWGNITMKIFMILFPNSICTCNSNPLRLYYTCMQKSWLDDMKGDSSAPTMEILAALATFEV